MKANPLQFQVISEDELVSISRLLSKSYGEDIAQDTIVRVLECQPSNPVNYARRTASGLAKKEWNEYTNKVFPMSQLERS